MKNSKCIKGLVNRRRNVCERRPFCSPGGCCSPAERKTARKGSRTDVDKAKEDGPAIADEDSCNGAWIDKFLKAKR